MNTVDKGFRQIFLVETYYLVSSSEVEQDKEGYNQISTLIVLLVSSDIKAARNSMFQNSLVKNINSFHEFGQKIRLSFYSKCFFCWNKLIRVDFLNRIINYLKIQ